MKYFIRLINRIVKFLGAIALVLLIFLFFTTFGYKTANISVKVAEISIVPGQKQNFIAEVTWLDGNIDKYELTGDQLYIDAKILKWKNWLEFFGMRTWYELDRIGGRYISISDEQNKPRTIYELAVNKDYDLYQLRKKYSNLGIFVDAEYGSAVFLLADVPKKIELHVARSGLTIKQVNFDQPPSININ